jgi:transketolase
MRGQLTRTVHELLISDKKIFIILGDIGVFSFREIFLKFPQKIINIGIMEQTMVGVAAGLALRDYIPIVHTISPFLVERAYEQLKIDFGYQKLNGVFVSVGSSYDYSKLGATHHCPADVSLISNIPGFIVMAPGSSLELDILLKTTLELRSPKYIRLSEKENTTQYNVEFGKLLVIKKGKDATLIVVGNLLDRIVSNLSDLDVNILYCTTIVPFDSATLSSLHSSNKIVIVEPYYSGTILNQVESIISGSKILSIGVSKSFISEYGSIEELDKKVGLDSLTISQRIREFINVR